MKRRLCACQGVGCCGADRNFQCRRNYTDAAIVVDVPRDDGFFPRGFQSWLLVLSVCVFLRAALEAVVTLDLVETTRSPKTFLVDLVQKVLPKTCLDTFCSAKIQNQRRHHHHHHNIS